METLVTMTMLMNHILNTIEALVEEIKELMHDNKVKLHPMDNIVVDSREWIYGNQYRG